MVQEKTPVEAGMKQIFNKGLRTFGYGKGLFFASNTAITLPTAEADKLMKMYPSEIILAGQVINKNQGAIDAANKKVAELQVQLDTVKAENETLKKKLAEKA